MKMPNPNKLADMIMAANKTASTIRTDSKTPAAEEIAQQLLAIVNARISTPETMVSNGEIMHAIANFVANVMCHLACSGGVDGLTTEDEVHLNNMLHQILVQGMAASILPQKQRYDAKGKMH